MRQDGLMRRRAGAGARSVRSQCRLSTRPRWRCPAAHRARRLAMSAWRKRRRRAVVCSSRGCECVYSSRGGRFRGFVAPSPRCQACPADHSPHPLISLKEVAHGGLFLCIESTYSRLSFSQCASGGHTYVPDDRHSWHLWSCGGSHSSQMIEATHAQ